MTTPELAKKVIEMLDTQKDFFKTREYPTLQKSKRLESELRKICTEILNPKPTGMADLFETQKKESND